MLLPIIVHLRAMQLYTHHAHNLCARIVFQQDHDFFGEVYSALDGEYDGVVERQIGLFGEDKLDLTAIIVQVHSKLKGLPTVGVKENKVFYTQLLEMEKQLLSAIQAVINTGVSEGTRQMLGDICDRSEVRQYKIKQRLK